MTMTLTDKRADVDRNAFLLIANLRATIEDLERRNNELEAEAMVLRQQLTIAESREATQPQRTQEA